MPSRMSEAIAVALLVPAALGNKCGGAVNSGDANNCATMLFNPTGDSSMNCYAYGGRTDPCSLHNNNDDNDGLDKDPSLCTGDTFFLWDEPDTQGRDYSWAGREWTAYAARFSDKIRTMRRERDVKFTTPLLKADNPTEYLRQFFDSCTGCSDPSSPAYIDVVAANPYCGSWNKPVRSPTDSPLLPEGTVEGCRGGARYVTNQLKNARSSDNQPLLGGRPVYMTNWAYLGTKRAVDQLPALEATDAFFEAGSPVERVYWFGATDFPQDRPDATKKNFLTDVVESGPNAGRTLGELWAEKCNSLNDPSPPSTLTCSDVWNAPAPQGQSAITCGGRITWVQQNMGRTEVEAGNQVAAEFPAECGPCAQPAPEPEPVRCTGAGGDPYGTGSHVACCEGSAEQLQDWGNNGNWYFKCVAPTTRRNLRTSKRSNE